jgi:hypothetical protein
VNAPILPKQEKEDSVAEMIVATRATNLATWHGIAPAKDLLHATPATRRVTLLGIVQMRSKVQPVTRVTRRVISHVTALNRWLLPLAQTDKKAQPMNSFHQT